MKKVELTQMENDRYMEIKKLTYENLPVKATTLKTDQTEHNVCRLLVRYQIRNKPTFRHENCENTSSKKITTAPSRKSFIYKSLF